MGPKRRRAAFALQKARARPEFARENAVAAARGFFAGRKDLRQLH